MGDYADQFAREAFTLPAPHQKFSKSEVERCIESVCSDMVGERRRYHFEEAPLLIKELCNEIQQRVLRLGYARYKLVTHAVIVEAGQQGLRVASRCLWDPETDNYATFSYSNETMHVSIVVFGLYWE